MRIFISYSSKDRYQAELIYESLKARKHNVFFSDLSLREASAYEIIIEKEIESCELMLFLISPNSVASGSYCLTELDIAMKKWKTANSNVFPVQIEATPIDAIPAFLRTVNILKPKGNIPAEVASAVDKLSWRVTRLIRQMLIAGILVALVVAILWYLTPPKANFKILETNPIAYERGFFGNKNIYKIAIRAPNNGKVAGKILDVTLETNPSNSLDFVRGASIETLLSEPATAAGTSFTDHLLVTQPAKQGSISWQACIHPEDSAKICSDFKNWKPENNLLFRDNVNIPPDLAENTRAVAWYEGSFFVAATNPNRIIKLNENGELLAEQPLQGVPTSISTGGLGIYLGLFAPNKIIKLSENNLELENEIAINLPTVAFDEVVSNMPANLAQDGRFLWFITRGGSSNNGLAYTDSNLSELIVPPYASDINFDLPGMTLRSGENTIWSGDNNTSPASIRHLTIEKLMVYGGHTFEIASCASDVLIIEKILYTNNCDGELHKVEPVEARLEDIGKINNVPGYKNSAGYWSNAMLGLTPDKNIVSAVSTSMRNISGQEDIKYEATLSIFKVATGSEIKFNLNNGKIIDMALSKTTALLIIEDEKGNTQLISLSLE